MFVRNLIASANTLSAMTSPSCSSTRGTNGFLSLTRISQYPLPKIELPLPGLASLLSELTSGDDKLAESAVPDLIQLGEPALYALLNLIDHEDSDHRWWAVRALSGFSHSSATEALIQSLSDPDPSVRHCAAVAFRHRPTPRAIPSLIEAFESDDRLFARLAGDALAALGSPAIPALSKSIQSANPALRGDAARALALMEVPETVTILFAAAEDPSTMVQHWIEEGLNRLGVGMTFFDL